MNIRNVALGDIKPYPNNAKVHPQKQIEAIAKSIDEFGFRQPLVLDADNNIIVGHARFEAAKLLGLDVVPCEYADNLSDVKIKAYRILDNKIAELGVMDLGMLQDELLSIPDFDFSEFNVLLSGDQVVIDDIVAEWKDMPEFEQENQKSFRRIIVHFASEQDVQEFSKVVYQKITDKTKYIWFPQQHIEDMTELRYESAS